MAYKPRGRKQSNLKLTVGSKEILQELNKTVDPSRREFLKSLLSIGGLSLLSGFIITDDKSVEKMLAAMSKWNDKAQGALFDPHRLAPTYTLADITEPFPFNAYYDEDEAPDVKEADYRLELSGLVANTKPWTLAQLRDLPQTDQITRHICVEGWSAIGRWGGVKFSDFLHRIGADTTAKYVGFKCADDYSTSIDMATALHPQTLLTLSFGNKDGTMEPLPRAYGFPMKLRMPTKLGFKNPKYITSIEVTNTNPGGYWEDQGYNWFSGV
jgi:DMSO/TMAO reductase YedYZ molybdopterin-dependent catalytic subunit